MSLVIHQNIKNNDVECMLDKTKNTILHRMGNNYAYYIYRNMWMPSANIFKLKKWIDLSTGHIKAKFFFETEIKSLFFKHTGNVITEEKPLHDNATLSNTQEIKDSISEFLCCLNTTIDFFFDNRSNQNDVKSKRRQFIVNDLMSNADYYCGLNRPSEKIVDVLIEMVDLMSRVDEFKDFDKENPYVYCVKCQTYVIYVMSSKIINCSFTVILFNNGNIITCSSATEINSDAGMSFITMFNSQNKNTFVYHAYDTTDMGQMKNFAFMNYNQKCAKFWCPIPKYESMTTIKCNETFMEISELYETFDKDVFVFEKNNYAKVGKYPSDKNMDDEDFTIIGPITFKSNKQFQQHKNLIEKYLSSYVNNSDGIYDCGIVTITRQYAPNEDKQYVCKYSKFGIKGEDYNDKYITLLLRYDNSVKINLFDINNSIVNAKTMSVEDVRIIINDGNDNIEVTDMTEDAITGSKYLITDKYKYNKASSKDVSEAVSNATGNDERYQVFTTVHTFDSNTLGPKNVVYEHAYQTMKDFIETELVIENDKIIESLETTDKTEIIITQLGGQQSKGSSTGESSNAKGFGNAVNQSSFRSSNNGANMSLSHNGNKLFEKENGTITKNKIGIGKLIAPPTVVWKVGKLEHSHTKCIIKLELLPDSEYVRPIGPHVMRDGRKERCNKAMVLEIQEYRFDQEVPIIGQNAVNCVHGGARTLYIPGQEVYPDKWNPDESEICTNGIHVYENRNDVRIFGDTIPDKPSATFGKSSATFGKSSATFGHPELYTSSVASPLDLRNIPPIPTYTMANFDEEYQLNDSTNKLNELIAKLNITDDHTKTKED